MLKPMTDRFPAAPKECASDCYVRDFFYFNAKSPLAQRGLPQKYHPPHVFDMHILFYNLSVSARVCPCDLVVSPRAPLTKFKFIFFSRILPDCIGLGDRVRNPDDEQQCVSIERQERRQYHDGCTGHKGHDDQGAYF